MVTGRTATEHFIGRPSVSIFAQETIRRKIDDIISGLPNLEQLSPRAERGIIARYTAVLEGNFIYWMTGTLLSLSSEQARAIVQQNLREEVHDNHPGMLRRFAFAARAYPNRSDHTVIHKNLKEVRDLVGSSGAVQLLLMMAFFEGFIAEFMPYLAALAIKQGSTESEYTDVHCLVDVTHTEQLFCAIDSEISLRPTASAPPALEAVEALQRLLEIVIHAKPTHRRIGGVV